ncbi:MAG: helix-turn-helix transcriptional regulator [Fimbriimonas sp.]|nr:helix-turn-helix transcriptional regulator [Fimbriimonas sp.]
MRFKSDPEALILAALADGPKHGYGIVKQLKDGSSGLFKMNEGQLYPLLHRMQESGWIKGEWETTETGPARKTYVLTESGRLELEKRRQEWAKFSSAVSGVILTVNTDPRLGEAQRG